MLYCQGEARHCAARAITYAPGCLQLYSFSDSQYAELKAKWHKLARDPDRMKQLTATSAMIAFIKYLPADFVRRYPPPTEYAAYCAKELSSRKALHILLDRLSQIDSFCLVEARSPPLRRIEVLAALDSLDAKHLQRLPTPPLVSFASDGSDEASSLSSAASRSTSPMRSLSPLPEPQRKRRKLSHTTTKPRVSVREWSFYAVIYWLNRAAQGELANLRFTNLRKHIFVARLRGSELADVNHVTLKLLGIARHEERAAILDAISDLLRHDDFDNAAADMYRLREAEEIPYRFVDPITYELMW